MKERWLLLIVLLFSVIAICFTYNPIWKEGKKLQDFVSAFKNSNKLWPSSFQTIQDTSAGYTRAPSPLSSKIKKPLEEKVKAVASKISSILTNTTTADFPSSTRFLYIEQSGGFTHNQLNTFSAAFRLSRAWKRKLVLPFPTGGKQWMGWLEHEKDISPWDLSHLHKHFDFTDVIELTRLKKNYSHVLQLPVKNGCIVGYNRFLDGSKLDRFEHCHTVLIDGVQMVDTSKLGVPLYAFFEHLHVSKLVMQTAQDFIKSVKWQEPMVGVHHRTWCENSETTYEGKYNKSYEVCSGMLTRWIHTWKAVCDPSLHSQLPRLFDNCLRSPATLEYMLASLPNYEIGRGPFFFSTDGQFPEIDEPFKKLGATEFDFGVFERSVEFRRMIGILQSNEFKTRTTVGKYRPDVRIFKQMYHGLIDATILVLSNFFVAHPMSSVSWSVCLWRGPERANMSNFCDLFVKLNTVRPG